MATPSRCRERLTRRRLARETRTRTFACAPAAIEKRACPRTTFLELWARRLRAISFVRPEQPPLAAAGQRRRIATNLPLSVSLRETSRAPAKGTRVAGFAASVVV